MKKIYVVWANEDSTEGRGRNEIRYFCSNKEAALDLSTKLGPMGCSDGYVKEAWLVDSRDDENKSRSIEHIKKEALKKLTKDEKFALGLND